MSSPTLWGEIPTILDTESGIAVLEREQITKRKALPIDGPALFQPSKALTPILKPPARSFTYNPTIIHTIKLLQYANKVRNLINQAQLQEMTNGNTNNLPSSPLIPSQEGTEFSSDSDMENNFLNSEIFKNGLKKWPEEISNTQAIRLSRFDVGVICAHAGFDTTPSSVMDFLADVSRSYTQQICKLLRHAVDNKVFNISGNSGDTLFVNALERVFHDTGIGSTISLDKFYENRVIHYHKNILSNCKALQEEYEKMRNLDNKSQFEDLKMIRIKEEPIVDVEIPIIKEEEKNSESANDSSTPFEELQNLSNIEPSLKDEENMKWPSVNSSNIKIENSQQNLASDLELDEEIINVSDSPNASEAPKAVNKDSSAENSSNRSIFQKLPKIRKLK